MSDELPLRVRLPTELVVRQLSSEANGLNAKFGATAHCVASEPDATFIRMSVTDDEQELAYEVAVLARLRTGYRVLPLRGPLGTRIELCYIFVRIRLSGVPNVWNTPRQARARCWISDPSRVVLSSRGVRTLVSPSVSDVPAVLFAFCALLTLGVTYEPACTASHHEPKGS